MLFLTKKQNVYFPEINSLGAIESGKMIEQTIQ